MDVVTERSGNLHADLLRLIEMTVATPGQDAADLYAAAYHTITDGEALRLQAWMEALAVGARLPTLPLWIGADQSLPIDLEQTYAAACTARRIA